MTIKVAIADDHSLVRQGLRRYLDMADGIEVVGEASNGKELLELVSKEQPDIADRHPDAGDGRPGGRAGDQRQPRHGRRDHAHRLRRPAVRGRGRARRRARLRPEGTRRRAPDPDGPARRRGEHGDRPQLVVALAEELSTAKERDRRAETLTAREIEVLQLLAFGHTNRDIAERLYISPDTVKTHLEHIFEKLGASDRTAAVAEALRRRLIE